MPKAAGAPLAPIERAWEVPTLELYTEWWQKTEACSGRTGDMSKVKFFAVDAPNGAIGLNGTIAHGWWVRQGNRIYLPANALGEEWLVRHEMLHALLRARLAPEQEVRRGLPPRLDRGVAGLDAARRSRQPAGPLARPAGATAYPAAGAPLDPSPTADSRRRSACSSARVGPTKVRLADSCQ